jgi:hypothetical protein
MLASRAAERARAAQAASRTSLFIGRATPPSPAHSSPSRLTNSWTWPRLVSLVSMAVPSAALAVSFRT